MAPSFLKLLINSPSVPVSDADPEYAAFYFQRSKMMMRTALLATAAIFLVSAVMDLVLSSVSKDFLVNFRLYVFLPVLFLEFFVSLTPWFEKHHQGFLAFGTAVVANAAGLFRYFLPDTGRAVFFYEFNPLILIVFSFTICRFTFRNALFVSLTILGTFEAAELALRTPWTTPAAWETFVSTNRVIASFFLVCVWACLYMQNQIKQEFIDRNRLMRLDRLKTEFFSNVSHELRTPLTLILGPLEGLRTSAQPIPPDSPVLEMIERNTRKLLGLINSLLDFTKLEEGRMTVRRSLVDVYAFLKRLVDSMDSAARSRGLSLALFDHSEGLVTGMDPALTEKVVLNLLSNALKFTPEGGTIAVELGGAHDGGFSICVQDNGIGIERDHLPYVFDRFYQIDSTMSRKYSGTGIGLALAKQAVEVQGGSITVQSQPGRGTTFAVWLPLRDSDADGAQRTAPETTARAEDYLEWYDHPVASASGPDGTSRHVLIVEDNADMRAYIKSCLGESYAYSEAEGGREGLEAVKTFGPDLILTDLMMPGMDGMQFLSELRARGLAQGTPVLLVSARAADADRLAGLEAGAVDFLTKPFSPRELAAKVKSLIELKGLQDIVAQKAEQLLLSEARFREIAEFAASAILEVAADGRTTYANQTAIALLGPQAVGRPIPDLVEQPDRKRLQSALDKSGRFAGPPLFRFHTRDGAVATALLRVSPGPHGEARIAFMEVKPILSRFLMPGDELCERYRLTERERDVVEQMLCGRSIKEIGQQLFISEPTVKSHQQNIYNKVGISSKKELLDLVRRELLDRYGKDTLVFSLLSGIYDES